MLTALPPTLLCLLSSLVLADSSPKRGLVYVGNNKYSTDDVHFWTSGDLTWYYNYAAYATPQLVASKLKYVPMLWGSTQGTSFLSSITSQVKSGGANITHVLAFNEPDMATSVGGSNMSPSTAAALWKSNLAPLQKNLGIKIGAPAVSGSPIGYAWLQDWLKACGKDGCKPDFLPVHWYGDFAGLASWIGNMSSTFPDLDIWVTEFALPAQDLIATQSFYNQSIQLLDGWQNVTRYSYFGAFRSSSSNIGPAAAMLTQDGKLTDVGSWYLGGAATGQKPKGSGAANLPSPSRLCEVMALSLALAMTSWSRL